MIRRFATAADFTLWEEKAATMTAAELHYAAVDSLQVAQNWRGVDETVESFYLDQFLTYQDALNRMTIR
jgi:hypothetical protein